MIRYLQHSTKFNCKNNFVIYLLGCKKCHIQYVDKAKMDFNLRLSNHHKDVYKGYTTSPSPNFAIKGRMFNRNANKFVKTTQYRDQKEIIKIKEEFLDHGTRHKGSS